jgi:tetratricopeptide (TPR) repeat protein
MSRTEAELTAMLEQARRMGYGEAQTALMEDVVRHADAGGLHRLAFAARRDLANAYSVGRQWDKAFPLFSRCLSEYDARPGEFGPEADYALRNWYAHIAQSMAEFPEISLAQIYGAFEDMERRFRAGGHSLRRVHEARRWVAQLARDWPEEERCYRAWQASGGPDPDSVWDFEAEIERLVLRGDDASVERALAMAGPVLAGERTFTEPPAPIQCLLLLPLARAGRFDEAAKAFHRARRAMYQDVYRFEYGGMKVEFCALTGNEDTGLSALREHLGGYPTLNRPNGKMEFATAGAVLLRRLVEAGRGDETVRAAGSDLTWTVAELYQEMDGTARELAARFDRRNGTTNQGDQIRARLAAPPVVDFLPLTPTARKAPRPVPIPPGTPPEALLDRAEWHEQREEHTEASRCLDAAGTPPPHLAARHAELTALIAGGDDAENRFRWAAEAHRQAGDHLRHLVCQCRLGYWLSRHGQAKKGLKTVARAVAELHRTGDHRKIAYGELLHARALVQARDDHAAYSALARGAQHARLAGDPLLIGSLALTEARWRQIDNAPPAQVMALADVARGAYTAAGSPGQLVAAHEVTRKAHDRAGTPGLFTAWVETELAALPPTAPARLRGYLRYRRGLALMGAGRPADALEDLIDAVGEARSRDDDTAEQGYELAVAYRAAGRVEDAVQAADDVAAWLDRLRELGRLEQPRIADDNRFLLAEGYRMLGDHTLALEEYDRLTANARAQDDPRLLVNALIPAAQIHDLLDQDATAAQAYREAGDAATRLGDRHLTALCRAAEALSLHWAGEGQQALAVLAQAEEATRALPAEPAARLTMGWALTFRSAAHILAGAGRMPEATDRAVRAAAAFRQLGQPADAAEMDLLHGGILLDADRPDLAEPILRAALNSAPAGTPLQRSASHTLALTLERLGRTAEARPAGG